jgi:hypothetical protein
MAASEFSERFRDLADLFDDEVLPDSPLGLDLRKDGAVGINRIAAMDKEVRRTLAHGFI